MRKKCSAICVIVLVALIAVFMTSCARKDERQSFAEAHDAFETKLVKQLSDQDEIPAPPEGVFDLVYYDTKVGKLAAYASSDPGDGQKHPMIIWIVGGWGYGIDEFPWTYPEWDNDQTGSAFRESGILMMYPSFRGANGNPGYYESVFGEIDDIAAAYDYAATLPYVDPDRIYLGGHSTGGTKVLLASEYTDKFRAVFAFGPVDEIKNHNTSQFTFDTSSQEEYRLRSPIHWLGDIKTPTFIIEGEDGNSECVRKIEESSDNGNIYCYIIGSEDHFTVLAPLTRLVAQKILEDTGSESNITLTQSELQDAMKTPPVKPMPPMKPYRDENLGLRLEIPAIWENDTDYDEGMLAFYSLYDDDNFWDTSTLYAELYGIDFEFSLEAFAQELNPDYTVKTVNINGRDAHVGEGTVINSSGSKYFNKVMAVQRDELLVMFWFYVPAEYESAADLLFEEIINSIDLE